MDIRQLKYFLAVAKLESLTAASRALNVTQPAIGQQIRKLEDTLGVRLLARHSRGMRLTPVGKLLHRRAQEIVNIVEQTEREVSRHKGTSEGTVRIGVTPSLSRVLVPRLMEVCFDRHPGVTMLFQQGYPNDLKMMWEEGECDFAIIQQDIETHESESLPIYRERLCLIGSPSVCASIPERVSALELAGLPLVLDERSVWLRAELEREFKSMRISFSDVIESSSLDIRRGYLFQGRRLAIAPVAQFLSEIETGMLMFRHINLESFERTMHLVGPRVEMMTATESSIRILILEIVDTLVIQGGVGWSAP